MTDLKLSASEEADVERVTNQIETEVVGKVQSALSRLEWTDELDSEDWAQLQTRVLERMAR
jgi:hypothetical protein